MYALWAFLLLAVPASAVAMPLSFMKCDVQIDASDDLAPEHILPDRQAGWKLFSRMKINETGQPTRYLVGYHLQPGNDLAAANCTQVQNPVEEVNDPNAATHLSIFVSNSGRIADERGSQ